MHRSMISQLEIFANEYKADLYNYFCHPQQKSFLAKLNISRKTKKNRLKPNYIQSSSENYKRRLTNRENEIVPRFQNLINNGDGSRTLTQHAKCVEEKSHQSNSLWENEKLPSLDDVKFSDALLVLGLIGYGHAQTRQLLEKFRETEPARTSEYSRNFGGYRRKDNNGKYLSIRRGMKI